MAPASYDLSFYHRTDSLLETFTRLADPSRCAQRLTVDNIHDQEDPSFQLRVATFADAKKSQNPRTGPRVLINFGAHGRELITSEVALRLGQILCGEADSIFAGDSIRSRNAITHILRQATIKLIPVQVPSSRHLAEVGGGNCRQRQLTKQGVDVNRNWNISWTAGDGGGEHSNHYRGPRPFSEPETRSLANFAQSWRPDVFVDVRSGDR